MMLLYLFINFSIIFATQQLDLEPTNKHINMSDPSKPSKCITHDNREGVCVMYYLCNENETVITDGAGIIDPRINERTCYSYLDVCCKLQDVRDSNNPITPKPQARKGCGWRNPGGLGVQVAENTNGEFSEFGEFPWMVAIMRLESVDSDIPAYRGGGSLIHPSVVLTAAHVVDETHKYRVRAGEWDVQTDKEIFPYQERDVKEIVTHKDYYSKTLFYDISLLFLERPMDMAPNVGLICLPPHRQETEPGTTCYATGWGKDRFGVEGIYQSIMKKVDLPVVNRRVCQNQLRNTRLGKLFELHSSFLCAGGVAEKDTCRGDGGSPLVCPIETGKERYFQSGIVAWGINCGQQGIPAVYVDVAKLREWIDDKIIVHLYDTSLYTYE